MKRFSLAVLLGLTVMLLAWAPQLRADGTDHFNFDDHEHGVAAMSSSPGEKALHSHAWKDNDMDDHNNSGSSNSGSSSECNGNEGNQGSNSSSNSGSGSMHASAPEPSTLVLLLSGLLAAAVGLKVKKAAA